MNLIQLAPLVILFLFGGHAIADYGLQSAYMAEHKIRKQENPDWFVTLFAHSLIHGVFVLIIALAFLLALGFGIKALTLAAILGWTEALAHFIIDDSKGQGRFSYRADQALHYGCKLLWSAIILILV